MTHLDIEITQMQAAILRLRFALYRLAQTNAAIETRRVIAKAARKEFA